MRAKPVRQTPEVLSKMQFSDGLGTDLVEDRNVPTLK